MIYGIRSDHGIPPEQDSSAKASTAANRTPIHIIDSDGSLLLRSARWGSMGLFCKHIIAIKASLINHLRPGSTECPDCDPDRALVSIQSYDPPPFLCFSSGSKGTGSPDFGSRYQGYGEEIARYPWGPGQVSTESEGSRKI